MNHPRSVRFNGRLMVIGTGASNQNRSRSSRPYFGSKKNEELLYSPYDFYTAASLGDIPFVERKLASGFCADSSNSSGWNALIYAAQLGHTNICSKLLDYVTSIDIPNSSGQTALMLAASCGHLPVAELLLSKGAKLNYRDNFGDTALSVAVACCHRDLVGYLLKAGADPNNKNEKGMTPTLIACSTGNEPILLALLRNGGNAKVKNDEGEDGEALAAENPNILAILRDSSIEIMDTAQTLDGNVELEIRYLDGSNQEPEQSLHERLIMSSIVKGAVEQTLENVVAMLENMRDGGVVQRVSKWIPLLLKAFSKIY